MPSKSASMLAVPKTEVAKGWNEVAPGIFVLSDEAWAQRRAEADSKPSPLLADPEIKRLVDDIRGRYDLDDKT